MSHRAMLRATLLLVVAVILAGCSLALQRTPASAADSGGSSGDTQAQCENLRAEIKTNETQLRQAPTTSVNEDIVAAAQGNAQKRLDNLHTQYDALGCATAKLPPEHGRFAPLPPAPGAPQT